MKLLLLAGGWWWWTNKQERKAVDMVAAVQDLNRSSGYADILVGEVTRLD